MNEETKKTKELSPEELDNVSGGMYCNPEKMLWQEDLAKSRNPNGFGSTFDEWKQLQPAIKEGYHADARCPFCGSWKTKNTGGLSTGTRCGECSDGYKGGFTKSSSKLKYGVKGLSIYY